MKNWLKRFTADDEALGIGYINIFIVLFVALITKIFNSDVSIFTGVAFLVGFIVLVAEWIAFRKSDTVPAGACLGLIYGTLITYFLGV